MVRDVVDGNRYLALGTVEPDGRPRVTPVYYNHDEYRTYYWVSSPQARHSANLTRQPAVSIVVFDSSVEPAQTRAVYVDATAAQVPDDELAAACAVAFRSVGRGRESVHARRAFRVGPAAALPGRGHRATPSTFEAATRPTAPASTPGSRWRCPTPPSEPTAGTYAAAGCW